jgi:hypothetical protein
VLAVELVGGGKRAGERRAHAHDDDRELVVAQSRE